jgi:hypothetical protein
MSLAQAEEHQRRHGFAKAPDYVSAKFAHLKPKLRIGRQPNKTEASFGLILEAQKRKGEIIHYVYEGISLRWGDGMRYTCDWAVFIEDMPIKLIEVKGAHLWDRDIVRYKGCKAEWKTWFDFELYQKSKHFGWKQIM